MSGLERHVGMADNRWRSKETVTNRLHAVSYILSVREPKKCFVIWWVLGIELFLQIAEFCCRVLLLFRDCHNTRQS
jgi:hypothetical protein